MTTFYTQMTTQPFNLFLHTPPLPDQSIGAGTNLKVGAPVVHLHFLAPKAQLVVL